MENEQVDSVVKKKRGVGGVKQCKALLEMLVILFICWAGN